MEDDVTRNVDTRNTEFQ